MDELALWLWLQHYDDLIDCYARQCGPGTQPPMVPDWYWRHVLLGGLAVVDLRGRSPRPTPCIPNHG